jgi:hypothetical protein
MRYLNLLRVSCRVGDALGIKDGVGFQKEGKENTKIKVSRQEFPKFVKEKGKTPIVLIVHTIHASVMLLMILWFLILMLMLIMSMLHMLILYILHLLEHLVLGIMFLMIKFLICLMSNQQMHQMVHDYHITLLMFLLCLLKISVRLLPNMLDRGTRTPNLVFGCQKRLLLM